MVRTSVGAQPHDITALNPDQIDHYEERAAIMEYDGGLTRKEAERRALSAAQE